MADKPPPENKATDTGQTRVRKWQEFKQLVTEKQPGSIVYILEQNGFSPDKEITILRVLMLHERRYYIFIDTPKGDALRETTIPLHKDKNGIQYLDDQEVKSWLKAQFDGQKLDVFSFWTT